MRILVNATTLVSGGGVQVGASFIEYVLTTNLFPQVEFLCLASKEVYENTLSDLRSGGHVRLVTPSPARLIRGLKSRRTIAEIESVFRPHLVYSVGSPSYLHFVNPEVARFTDPWGTHPSRLAWRALPTHEAATTWLREKYKMWWLRKVAHFETQTATSAKGLVSRLSLMPGRVHVLPNTYSFRFSGAANSALHYRNPDLVRILTVSAPYHHKYLVMIPRVAANLRDKGLGGKYRFVVTLPDSGPSVRKFWKEAEKNRVRSMIENVGRVTVAECVELYQQCTIVFLPTLLETFSATYLESMVMQRPIVTTDLDFAHDICGNAAMYYSPLLPDAAAQAIHALGQDPQLRDALVSNGRKRLASFPQPEDKYRRTVEWLIEIIEQSNMNNQGIR